MFELPSVLFSYQFYFDFEYLFVKKTTKSEEEMVWSLLFCGKGNSTYRPVNNHVQSKQ